MYGDIDDRLCVLYEGGGAMTDFRGYLIRLTAAAILGAVIRKLAPSGGAGRAAKLGAGLLVLITAFSPIASINTAAAAQNLVQHGYADPLNTMEFSKNVNDLLSELITEQAEAYILDKAQELGLALTVEVTAKVEDTYPVPYAVRLSGSPTAAQMEKLKEIIAADLKIPEERQEWLNM